jgi:CubicO group peptidase (beta-lactamase class C family)
MKHSCHPLFVILVLIGISVNTIHAQQLDSIRYVIDSTLEKSPFYGNILITQKGKTIFEKSYGYADVLNKKKLGPHNSFQIASVSKQFTAYGIMILHQAQQIDYDKTVDVYLPGFPYHTITVRHLLTHTSGLPDFWDHIRTKLDTTASYGNQQVLEYLVRHTPPLQFEPGSQFEYCDIGYDFLAMIIENVSGLSYTDYLNNTIFKPLKMKHTIAYKVTDIRRIDNDVLAIGHQLADGKYKYAHLLPQNGFIFYLGDFYGDGSIVSTAKDLALWNQALKSCALLPCVIQQESMEPYKMNNGSVEIDKGLGYGYGWFIKQTPAGKLVYHTGHHPGNALAIYRFVERDLCFIFLSNSDTGEVRALRARILYFLQH